MAQQTMTIAPLAHGPGEGDAYWSWGGLTTIKASAKTTGGSVGIIEQIAPRGAGSPLHIHHNENEMFYVLEGELTFWVGGDVIVAPAGSYVFGPKEIPHTFIVSSDEARFLLAVEPGGFEEFIIATGEPAPRLEIPPPPTEAPDVEAITTLAAEYGLDIIGPPGIPD